MEVSGQIFTWNKILETNWKRRFAPGEIEETSGTNPTTNFINQDIQKLFSTIGMPIFGVLIVVLTIFGELNFWSTQVSYQTEPISSIGQWANIVATVLVVFGSLYYVQKPRNTIEMEDLGPGQSQASISPETRSSSQSNRDQV
jgi:uncharacterized BrkB/YihY/UPF0761 family membrane protein